MTRRGFLLQGVALPAILNHPEIPSGSRRPLHPVWQKLELALQARRRYANPYTDATVWVDLEGPGFHRRVYGFWDGGSTFRVRLLATAPGLWRWRSGSRPHDPGLAGQRGSFQARAWTPDELAANPLRRGYPRATANRHALEHPDGTPFFSLPLAIPGGPPALTVSPGMTATAPAQSAPRLVLRITSASAKPRATTGSI